MPLPSPPAALGFRTLLRRPLAWVGVCLVLVVVINVVSARRSQLRERASSQETWATTVTEVADVELATRSAELLALSRAPDAVELVDAYASGDPDRWARALSASAPRLRALLAASDWAYSSVDIIMGARTLVLRVLPTSQQGGAGEPGSGPLVGPFVTAAQLGEVEASVVGHLAPGGLIPPHLAASWSDDGVSVLLTHDGGTLALLPSSSTLPNGPVTRSFNQGWTLAVSSPYPSRTVLDGLTVSLIALFLAAIGGGAALAAHWERNKRRRRGLPDPRSAWILDWLTYETGETGDGDALDDGRLAELSHEIRNPLSSLRMNLQGLERDLRNGGPYPDAPAQLDICLQEIDRLDTLARTTLDFSRAAAAERERVDVVTVLERAIHAVAAPAAEARVTIRMNPSPHHVIEVDPGQVEGTLVNLMLNAIQASDGGAEVRTWVEAPSDASGPLTIHVEDSGPGVPQEARARIFEPFFTTKPRGTGIGLALARKTAIAHGGSLRLRPRDGRGAHFVLELPSAESRIP